MGDCGGEKVIWLLLGPGSDVIDTLDRAKHNRDLRGVERDFIVIAEPFPLAIRVALDAHETAVARRAEDLDDGSDLIHERGNRPPPLPNDHPIPDGRFASFRQWCLRTARLLPCIFPNDA
jgi:hypothetical protein